ncbi:hypothetical protein [Dethiobacter alkaliphilus]|uniref:Uncharacterized protein n=1 Tax=Dethiobacter alkaliphilus AHT 1 TaxID=555088 RepID=C0GF55_DETAL|nr:hypothetical protein [Dethiobacter alkaliphilus]EEG78237.1 hypothetical protein DealDRAFT_1114 [Dethiobacter alkaliphilus AHT 1]
MSCNNKKNKKLSKKELKNCRANQNCNASDVTDSVEFADEPFADVSKKKCARDKRNKK